MYENKVIFTATVFLRNSHRLPTSVALP